MGRRTKGNLLLLLVSLILMILLGLVNHYLARSSNKGLGTTIDIAEKDVQEGWDLSALEGIKKLPGIFVKIFSSLKFPSKLNMPFTSFQCWLFNLGLPVWATLILTYILFPAGIGIVSWFASNWFWQRIKRKGKLCTKIAIFFFFFFCGLILLKSLKGQFDELLFILVILFLVPSAINILLRESRLKKKNVDGGEKRGERMEPVQ